MLRITHFDRALAEGLPKTHALFLEGGLFKIQKGFDGFVTGPAVDCSKMFPLITIWTRGCDRS
ncbi:MAG: hypothetical protein ACYTHM_19020 [Planctomycetota bacterium]|jgi:hypothetical protein